MKATGIVRRVDDPRGRPFADNIDIVRRIHHDHAGIVKAGYGKLYILTNTAGNR